MHYQIENLLDDKDFAFVKDFALTRSVNEKGRTNFVLQPDNDVQKILSSALRKICLEIGCSTSGYKELIEFSCCMPGFNYNKIHADDRNKKFVFVYHVSEHGVGTKLYKFPWRSSYAKTTSWIPNGGHGFYRSFKSWHDWDTVHCNTPRVTFNLIIAKNEYVNSYYK